jgi:hypothetical protein
MSSIPVRSKRFSEHLFSNICCWYSFLKVDEHVLQPNWTDIHSNKWKYRRTDTMGTVGSHVTYLVSAASHVQPYWTDVHSNKWKYLHSDTVGKITSHFTYLVSATSRVTVRGEVWGGGGGGGG